MRKYRYRVMAESRENALQITTFLCNDTSFLPGKWTVYGNGEVNDRRVRLPGCIEVMSMQKHLLALQDFTKEELLGLIDRAIVLKKESAEGKRHQQLAGKTVSLIFEKPSTRTRVSFESAMYGLGGQVIFLSSKDEEFDKILGLQIGADDYLCKPFSIRELVMRVKVLLRRLMLASQAVQPDELISIDGLELDLQRYIAKWKNQKLDLTITEFMLLQSLIRQPGYVKTREKLMEEAYPDHTFVTFSSATQTKRHHTRSLV
jgi:hypothetical protein